MRKKILYFVAVTSVISLGIIQAEEMTSQKIYPKDPSVEGTSNEIWRNPKNSMADSREQSPDTTAKVEKNGAKRPSPEAQCAGEWTRAVGLINEPAYQNMLVIRNATSSQDAWRRANICRRDVQQTSFFNEGVRLACAPYIACNAN